MKLSELLAQHKQKTARLSELLAKGEEMTVEELTETETLDAEITELDANVKSAQALAERAKTNAARVAAANTLGQAPLLPVGGNGGELSLFGGKDADVLGGMPGGNTVQLKGCPVEAILSSRSKYFTGPTRYDANVSAYRFGMFVLAAFGQDAHALQFCKDNGIQIKAGAMEGRNDTGGFLVPIEFESQIIDLKEKFGIFRQYAYNDKMASDTKRIPRRAQGVTSYFVMESGAGTESAMKWDGVELTARKMLTLVRLSNELGEDAIIDYANRLLYEIAYSQTKLEDQCGFIGDGTSQYGKITGATTRLKNVWSTSGGLGLKLASGPAWSNITMNDLIATAGLLPQYAAETGETAWYCSRTFYWNVMVELMVAAGGTTMLQIAAGLGEPRFMGYPVRIAQAMPGTGAVSQVPVFFGDLSLAATLGDRRQTTLAVSDQFAFNTDELLIRGTERIDINVHDVGFASSVDGHDIGAGPIVGLITTAS